jgi:hypothetical protein
VAPEDLEVSISAACCCWGRAQVQRWMPHLFEKTCAKGAGELGESVYGLKEDFKPVVGEGMSCVAVAMPHDAWRRQLDASRNRCWPPIRLLLTPGSFPAVREAEERGSCPRIRAGAVARGRWTQRRRLEGMRGGRSRDDSTRRLPGIFSPTGVCSGSTVVLVFFASKSAQ